MLTIEDRLSSLERSNRRLRFGLVAAAGPAKPAGGEGGR